MDWFKGIFVILALFGVIMLIRKWLFSQRYYRLAAKIPGPKALPIIGSMHIFLRYIHRIPDRLLELMDEFNGTMGLWFGPKFTVCISNPDDLEVYFKSPKMLNRPYFYSFIEFGMGYSLFTKNGDSWKKSRKIITPAFHSNATKEVVPIFAKHSEVMIDVLKKELGKPAFNAWEYTRPITLDIVHETSFNYDLQMQYRNQKMFDGIEEAMGLICRRIYNIFFHPEIIWRNSPGGKRELEAIRTIRPFYEKMVDDGLNGDWKKESESDGISLLIKQLVNSGFSQEEILQEITGVTAAGYDTTSHTLAFILMMLGIHQDVQEKVYEEDKLVQRIVAGRELNSDDLQHYTYLERVIKETLRLYPAGPIIFREAMDEVQFPNFKIPKGAIVGCAMIKTHRDPKNFKNPLKFDPDNFLPENIEGRHPYAYVPFSSGPRGCIGMRYSMLSMKVIISTIVRNYRVYCDKTLDDIVLSLEITLRSVGGFPIRIEAREK